jgi:DNA-binding NtrC family response regulator
LFSDTLFGHHKGAFTGADGVRAGLVERAAGGTLFLDEIADLPTASQVKLLRLIQEREFYPLGADRPRRADVRVVVAANRDLWSDVCRERFRADLFHRLACHRIDLPPLRARRDDLPVLLDHFIAEAAADLGVKPPTPAKEILHLLGAYQFPGNIRELRAMVFDAVAGHKGGPLGAAVFKTHITRTGWAIPDSPPPEFPFPERLPTLKELDALAVAEALRRSGGNQSVAAMMLGISQQALSKRLAKDDESGKYPA